MAPPARLKFRLSLRVLAASAVFITLSVAVSEGLECYRCGPLAEQVHRSGRAPSCDAGTDNSSLWEYPNGYCAIVASSPPYAESRIRVRVHQEACYPIFCNTSKEHKIVCACLGDRCNGEKTEREIRAFSALKQAWKTQSRHKRQNQSPYQYLFNLVSSHKKSSLINQNYVEELNNEKDSETITNSVNDRKMIQLTIRVYAAVNQSESDNETTPKSMINVHIAQPPTKVSLVQKETEVKINKSITELSETMQIPKPTRTVSESTEPTLPPMADPDHVITTEKRLFTTEEIRSTTATTVLNTTNEKTVESSEVAYIQQETLTTERYESQQTHVPQYNTNKLEQNGANEEPLQKDAPELTTEIVQQKFSPQPSKESPQNDAPAMDTEELQEKYSPLPTMEATTLPKVIDTMKQTFATSDKTTVPSVNKNVISSTPQTIKKMKNVATKTNSNKLAFLYYILALFI